MKPIRGLALYSTSRLFAQQRPKDAPSYYCVVPDLLVMTQDGDEDTDGGGLPGILGRAESTHSKEQGESDTKESNEVSEESAFGLVGNETRANIIKELGLKGTEKETDDGVTFTHLRQFVDGKIDSGQFNYHLQKLVGNYVEKTEHGYKLRPEGKTLYRTIQAGTFTKDVSLASTAVGQECYYCEDPLEAAYDDGMFTIQCHGCETLYDLILAPPSSLESRDDFLTRVEGYNHHIRQSFVRGICPTCVNGLDHQLVDPAETGFSEATRRSAYVYRSCDHCGNQSYMSVGSVLLHHPAVISFCYERGLDVTTTPRWELEFAATDRTLTVRSTDPWEIELDVTVDEDTLTLVVDDQLSVTEQTVR